jgi:hypothetical protein
MSSFQEGSTSQGRAGRMWRRTGEAGAVAVVLLLLTTTTVVLLQLVARQHGALQPTHLRAATSWNGSYDVIARRHAGVAASCAAAGRPRMGL